MKSFASRIVHWQRQHGRHQLPWQRDRDPYRIWLSEVMLQQTQVATVIPYFERFVERFPDLASLAAADEDAVLALWSGLGYYSRGRNLLAAARVVAAHHHGRFPDRVEAIAGLPGVGRSTAAAIACLAFGQRHAILDGNVKRVLARHAGISGWPGAAATEAALWRLAEARLPDSAVATYTQGMMDLGALVCTRSRPDCDACPVGADCVARRQGRTAELPAARPKKTLPEKQVQMLLLFDRTDILLEKRPARGIWGGLWSLPELSADEDPVSHCQACYGVATHSRQTLAPLRHSFTHFRLHILPVRLQLAARGVTDHPGRQWLLPEAALHAALPAPVRTLLAQIVAG